MIQDEKKYEYWLASIQNLSDNKKNKLREHMNFAKRAYYIEETAGVHMPEGNFVLTDGTVIGRHKGITHYTVGQRKGKKRDKTGAKGVESGLCARGVREKRSFCCFTI